MKIPIKIHLYKTITKKNTNSKKILIESKKNFQDKLYQI